MPICPDLANLELGDNMVYIWWWYNNLIWYNNFLNIIYCFIWLHCMYVDSAGYFYGSCKLIFAVIWKSVKFYNTVVLWNDKPN